MAPKAKNTSKTVGKIEIKCLSDLIRLNLDTLENVVSGQIDNRKAAMIFTGSRTVTASLKLGIEAMKLGMKQVAGMPVEEGNMIGFEGNRSNKSPRSASAPEK